MSANDILITGATGNVGKEIINELSLQAVIPVAAGSSIDRMREMFGDNASYRKLDFYDQSTFPDAFKGIKRIFLMRPPAISNVKKYIVPLIEAAHEAGVEHFVLLSLQGAEKNDVVPHRKIEKYLIKRGYTYTFLRPSFFMQNLSTTHKEEIKERDEIYVPAGNGRTSFIDVKDISSLACKCLLEAGHENKAYELTGSDALTYYEAADIISEVTGRKITYKNPGTLKFLFRKLGEKLPFTYAFVMTSLYTVCKLGKAGELTDEFEKLMKRKPITFREFAENNKKVWEK